MQSQGAFFVGWIYTESAFGRMRVMPMRIACTNLAIAAVNEELGLLMA